ncbi:MAG: glycosyltransferase family 2 protein [Rhodobacteraceae bacterium]|nr:glycosyltransferase family 2 protein [Paracoccaceae bacterium]
MAVQDPTVSVIIPAHAAHGTIAQAVASVRRAGLAPETVEVSVASDDGDAYETTLADDVNCRFCPPGPVRSGPGPARNRAVDLAKGNFIAFLDADDTWADGYLTTLLPLAQHSGAAFASTTAFRDGRVVGQFGSGGELSLEMVGLSGASFHPLAHRDLVGMFATERSQDTFHTIEVLGLLGGTAPLGDTSYNLNLGDHSTTRQSGFAEGLAKDYQTYRDRILSGTSRVPAQVSERAAQAFRDRIALNDAFLAQSECSSFYDFIARNAGKPGASIAA